MRPIRILALSALQFWLWSSVPAAAEPPPSAGADHVAGRLTPSEPRVTSRLARDAIAAALRASGFPAAWVALDRMAARARSSAMLPEVWLRASRSSNESLTLSPTLDDPIHYSELGGAGVLLEARLIWHLDRLVFDRDEVSVERLKNERASAAARLSARVLQALFAWEKASWQMEDSKALPEDRDAASLAKVEAEVLLDVLTAGWFGARNAPSVRESALAEPSGTR